MLSQVTQREKKSCFFTRHTQNEGNLNFFMIHVGRTTVIQEDTEAIRLGADLRALRKRRDLTLSEMAATLGRSVGWLSQVERGLSQLSRGDLVAIADELNVSLGSLKSAVSQGPIVKRDNRRPIRDRKAGLYEELLSPDLTDDFEVVHSTFEPGTAITVPVSRPTQEVGYMVSGSLHLVIDDVSYIANAGDSFRIRGEKFLWANPSDVPAVAIWVIAPPVY